MKCYIRVEATNPPESIKATEIYMTDQGYMEYMFGLKTWYPEEKQLEPKWYLQEIDLSELMIEFINWVDRYYIKATDNRWIEEMPPVQGLSKTDKELLSEFLTQKGYIIKD